MPKKKSKVRKVADKLSRKITKAVGAKDFAKFTGEALAKRKNPAVKRTVTRKQGMKSAAKLGVTIATLGVGGAAKRAVKATARRKTKKAVTQGSSKAFLKRSVSGHERTARRAARKRAAAKRSKK